jgi:pimeloyl-ACP methyl ester carboxylesterase
VPALDRDGVQIAYDVVSGPAEATPLLLTHGYGASRAMWRPNLAAADDDQPSAFNDAVTGFLARHA